jgi:hypothetical protein
MNEKLNIDAIRDELKRDDLTVKGLIAAWTHPITGRSKRLSYEGMVLFFHPEEPDILPDTFKFTVATADDLDGAIAIDSLQDALDIYNNIDLSIPVEPYQLLQRAEEDARAGLI